MAIKNSGKNGSYQRYFGLSTDTKPEKAYIGDTFKEVDTGDEFSQSGNGNGIQLA